MLKLLNFGWIKKLVEMVVFPGKSGVDGGVLVNEVWRNIEGSNTTLRNALALVIKVIVAAVVVFSHNDEIFLLLLFVACGEIKDES